MNLVLRADPKMAEHYHAKGWWGDLSVADYVKQNAHNIPNSEAIITERSRVTWAEYDRHIDLLAGKLGALLDRDDRFGAYFPDCPEFHYALCAAERSGTIAIGIGARSELGELLHLMQNSEAKVLVMRSEHRGHSAADAARFLLDNGLPLETLIVYTADGSIQIFGVHAGELSLTETTPLSESELAKRRLSPDELSMLNSTSGTTGRPKLVTQFANRWIYFSKIAIDAADMTSQDVILGAIPGPFGFGLWTAHYAPAILGVPVVLMESFNIERMIELIVAEQVTVLACVSTQFKMMLDALENRDVDMESLRVMFTGGEAVPYERAREFEDRIGAHVLQFYGSNEGGAVTNTTLRDTAEQRLKTAGKISQSAIIKLLDGSGNEVTERGAPGQPAVAGPTITFGYFNDEQANTELFKDGLLLMPDIVTVDEDGYYAVVGRTSDLIIRGGKNISAVEVEEAVETHPKIRMAAAVPVPDELFGERIGVAIEMIDGSENMSLENINEYLAEKGHSKSLYPEHLLVVNELPLASGGKIAKSRVKELFVTK